MSILLSYHCGPTMAPGDRGRGECYTSVQQVMIFKKAEQEIGMWETLNQCSADIKMCKPMAAKKASWEYWRVEHEGGVLSQAGSG